MEATFPDSYDLDEVERVLLENIVEDTYREFEEVLDPLGIDSLRVEDEIGYKEFSGQEMESPGASPKLFRYNPIKSGELLIFSKSPLSVPHEMAHQIEDVTQLVQTYLEDGEVSSVNYSNECEDTFSEAFAYLNQLNYFNKMSESVQVDFNNLDSLQDSSLNWDCWNNSIRKTPDLHHPVGYRIALQLDDCDITPRQFLERSEEFEPVIEDAVAAAWLAGKTEGKIDEEQYSELLQHSIENRVSEVIN